MPTATWCSACSGCWAIALAPAWQTSAAVVHGAHSAEEAIELALAELPDIILMDIKMPQVDGLEATRRLKANPSTRRIPIITLTAHAMAEDRELAIAAGADDYESKPVDLPQLLEKMDVLLRPKSTVP